MVDPQLYPTPGETFFQYRVRRGDRRALHLARRSGVQRADVSRMENGKFVGDRAAARVAAVWDIPVEAVRDLIDNTRKVPRT